MSRPLLVKPTLISRGIFSATILSGSAVIGVSHFIKHTFLLNFLKNRIELQGEDGPIKPTEKLTSIFNDVSNDVKEFVSNHTFMVPFLVPGIRVIHGGTYGTIQGGIVGLPAFFDFNTKEDVEKNVVVNGPSHLSEEELSDMFLLSDEAKKYVIAREILLINSMHVYIKTCLPVLVAYSTEMLSKLIARHQKLTQFPVQVRAVYYLLVTVVGLMIWNVLSNNFKHYYEADVENKICKLDSNYMRGGIEYYSKECKRNQFQVNFKNQTSSLLKTVDDFIVSLLSFKEIPVVRKIAYLKAHLDLDSKKLAAE
ncbi:transmembrane protein 177-like [Homalodisca vitripennis]|uniref:transmembrane protein 177-like n=1 Tax=Homalodisca vitripennis TaxID=197043 RepID=UPI001EEA2329|nr:transmembrane protein 177-like [Homalodisca vitripennis]